MLVKIKLIMNLSLQMIVTSPKYGSDNFFFISLGIYVISRSNIYPVSLDWAGYCSRSNAVSFSRSQSKSRSLQSTRSMHINDEAPSKRTS